MAKGIERLETATTKHPVESVALSVLAVVVMFVTLLHFRIVEIQMLNALIDSLLKATALIGGAVWALNRYFTGRTDIPQLRVDPLVSVIPSRRFTGNPSGRSLLIYRLDIVNTGKTLIEQFEQSVEIHAVVLERGGITYRPISRWPTEDTHPGRPIEPGSWAAISNVLPVSQDIQAVRIYLELRLNNGTKWDWHRVFDLYGDTLNSSAVSNPS